MKKQHSKSNSINYLLNILPRLSPMTYWKTILKASSIAAPIAVIALAVLTFSACSDLIPIDTTAENSDTNDTNSVTNDTNSVTNDTTLPICGGVIVNDFVSKWDINLTTSGSGANSVALPLVPNGTYNFTVDWGDGTAPNTITTWNDPNATHTFNATTNVFTVTISGTIEGWRFAPQEYTSVENMKTSGLAISYNSDSTYSGTGTNPLTTDALKLVEISSFGPLSLGNTAGGQFFNAKNLTITASDAPGLCNTTSLSGAFFNADALGNSVNFSGWDVPGVEDFSYMFAASAFNSDISAWQTTSAQNMAFMFTGAANFNGNLNSWDVSKVTTMESMLRSTASFNSDISSWNVGSVTSMSSMFNSALAFNQNINSWDVANVTNMSSMFKSTATFNQNLNNWDVSSVTNMGSMFNTANAFNSDISSWNVANVTTMVSMFNKARQFNNPIGSWDVSSIVNMENMFYGATAFNQNLNSWNVSNVTTMRNMLRDTTSFNSDISSWNVGSVKDMYAMFYGASQFNQPLGSWSVGGVTDMTVMFYNASVFNKNISSWNVSSTTNCVNIFNNTPMSAAYKPTFTSCTP